MLVLARARNTQAARLLVRFFALAVLVLLAATAHGTPVSELPSGGGTRVVTDALGRDVTIPEYPSRIVSAGRSVLMIADALYLFESAPDRIIGLGRIDQGRGNFLPAIDPAYGDKAVLERNVGPEQVAALRPDLVILKSFMRESLGDGIERVGIPVLYVDLETPDQYQRDLALLGEVLGEEARARALAQYYRDAVDAVSARVSALEADERPSTLFLYADPAGGDVAFNVPPAGWIQTQLMELAGGEPVWTREASAGGWRTVTLEQIAAWNPDRIFLVAYRQDADAIRDGLLEDPAWQELAAVQSGAFEVFPVDYYSWDQPDARWALGLQWLATRMHPELFSNLRMEQVIYRFFSFAYRMDEEETDSIIFSRLTGDMD
jgi:iron complex transport system substrate-binding protein